MLFRFARPELPNPGQMANLTIRQERSPLRKLNRNNVYCVILLLAETREKYTKKNQSNYRKNRQKIQPTHIKTPRLFFVGRHIFPRYDGRTRRLLRRVPTVERLTD